LKKLNIIQLVKSK